VVDYFLGPIDHVVTMPSSVDAHLGVRKFAMLLGDAGNENVSSLN
jgi:hypothetical protein